MPKHHKNLICVAVNMDDYAMPLDHRRIFGDRLFERGLPYEEYFAVELNSEIRREDLLIDFLISLRTKGNYRDDILLIVYHEFFSSKFYEVINDLQIKLIRKEGLWTNSSYMVVQRFVDTLDIIEHQDIDTVMIFDTDIWFNKNIYGLIDEMPNRGLLLAPSGPMKFFGHPKDTEDLRRYLAKISLLYDTNGYRGICASFVGGKREPLIQRLRDMREYINRGTYFKAWGLDQFLLTYLANIKNDKISARYCLSIFKDHFRTNSCDSSDIYSFHIHQHSENRFYYIHPEIIKVNQYERYYESSQQVQST